MQGSKILLAIGAGLLIAVSTGNASVPSGAVKSLTVSNSSGSYAIGINAQGRIGSERN